MCVNGVTARNENLPPMDLHFVPVMVCEAPHCLKPARDCLVDIEEWKKNALSDPQIDFDSAPRPNGFHDEISAGDSSFAMLHCANGLEVGFGVDDDHS